MNLKIFCQRFRRFSVVDSTKWRKTKIGFLLQTVRLQSVFIRLVVVDGLHSGIPDR